MKNFFCLYVALCLVCSDIGAMEMEKLGQPPEYSGVVQDFEREYDEYVKKYQTFTKYISREREFLNRAREAPKRV